MKYSYPKTYAFLKKYSSKSRILLGLVVLLWLFAPKQKQHYLVSDVDDFSDAYYLSISIVLSVLIVLSTFLVVWRKRTIRNAFISLIPSSLIALYISFFAQSLIIGTCLWINRFSDKEQVQYTYMVTFDGQKSGRIISELQTSRMLYKEDTRNMELYRSTSFLQSLDTFNYTFNKGLLGIKYIPDNK